MDKTTSSIYGSDEVFDIEKWQLKYAKNDLTALENQFDISEIIMFIDKLNKEVDFFEELKKARVEPINEKISKNEKQIDFYKKVIILTLLANKKKSLKIPGLCNVSCRKKAIKWAIENQDELLNVLKNEKEYDNIVSEITEKKIDKKELNKLLAVWDEVGKLPSCVKKEEEEDDGTQGNSLTMSFEDKKEEKEEQAQKVIPELKATDLDKLEI